MANTAKHISITKKNSQILIYSTTTFLNYYFKKALGFQFGAQCHGLISPRFSMLRTTKKTGNSILDSHRRNLKDGKKKATG